MVALEEKSVQNLVPNHRVGVEIFHWITEKIDQLVGLDEKWWTDRSTDQQTDIAIPTATSPE